MFYCCSGMRRVGYRPFLPSESSSSLQLIPRPISKGYLHLTVILRSLNNFRYINPQGHYVCCDFQDIDLKMKTRCPQSGVRVVLADRTKAKPGFLKQQRAGTCYQHNQRFIVLDIPGMDTHSETSNSQPVNIGQN